MILLFKNIPSTTTSKDLRNFVEPHLKYVSFLAFKRGNIFKTDTFTYKDKNYNYPFLYGIVFVDTTKAGLYLIKKLNGKRYKNKMIEVREYFVRSTKNDRRLKQTTIPDEIRNKRKGDRRSKVIIQEGAKEIVLYQHGTIFDRENVYDPRRRSDD